MLFWAWLESGVSLGCNKASARMPTERPNMASSYEWGEMMTDTIQSWCAMGIAAGPYTRAELEARGWKIKINPMQVRVKPNGKLRIILDLSAPHLQEWEEKLGLPGSVNSGINKDDFRLFVSCYLYLSFAFVTSGVPWRTQS